MSKRLVLLIMGLFVAYALVYFGDGFRTLTLHVLKSDQDGMVIFSLILFAGAFLCFVSCVHNIMARQQNGGSNILFAMTCLACLACLYGMLAHPFTVYGLYPWTWKSHWDWLPIVGLIPTVLAAHQAISEGISERKYAKNDKVESIQHRKAR